MGSSSVVLLETSCEKFTWGIASNTFLRKPLQRRVADIYVGPFLIRFEQQLLFWTAGIPVSAVVIRCSPALLEIMCGHSFQPT
jgi:hypothetical protein